MDLIMEKCIKTIRLGLLMTLSTIMVLSTESWATNCDINAIAKDAPQEHGPKRCAQWPYDDLTDSKSECISCLALVVYKGCIDAGTPLTDLKRAELMNKCLLLNPE